MQVVNSDATFALCQTMNWVWKQDCYTTSAPTCLIIAGVAIVATGAAYDDPSFSI